MSATAINGVAVANLVTYIAPGFVARTAWRARYPTVDTPAGETLIVSAVMSLPLVALVQALIPGHQQPDQLGYVVALLGGSALLGYGAAQVRGTRSVRELLGRIGYQFDPAGSIYSQTLALMGKDESVVIELQDGRRVWGSPRKGPQHKDDGVEELYLVFPQGLLPDGQWAAVGEGLIVPIDQIVSIALSEDPTKT